VRSATTNFERNTDPALESKAVQASWQLLEIRFEGQPHFRFARDVEQQGVSDGGITPVGPKGNS
jgi:hypothetical protein